MNRLTRYSIWDSYSLEEVRRDYETADVPGRIRLLRNLYKANKNGPPYEVALRAVEDPNPQVRGWMARHGRCLDYGASRLDGDKVVYSLPERNLQERLRTDPDPFVRACLLENEAICPGLSTVWRDFGVLFQGASALERLALVRNPKVPEEFIYKLFDYEDQEHTISSKERGELIAAYLTNEDLAAQNEYLRREERFVDGDLIHRAVRVERHLTRLWELAATWPEGSGIPEAIYRYVNAPDSTKAKAYQAQKNRSLRQAILTNCDYRDRETLKLGREDADTLCREAATEAMQKPRRSPEEEIALEFRKEVRTELEKISWALRALRGWVIAIGVGVLLMVLTGLLPMLFR